MESELLKIFDDQRNEIGVATREEVHQVGHWHETFHCWFISNEEGKNSIYLQIRSDLKKDYPGLLDITAAGHLLSTEKVLDGTREVKEELGIDISFKELIPLGIIGYQNTTGKLIDKEFAHTFLYRCSQRSKDFVLQTEEVSGIVRADFEQFAALWLNEIDEVEIEGFEIGAEDQRISIKKVVTKKNFVPHEKDYYLAIINGIRESL